MSEAPSIASSGFVQWGCDCDLPAPEKIKHSAISAR
jgi:hypothetical protein